MEKKQRPKVTEGSTYKVVTGCGNMYVTPAWDRGSLIEVFARLGRSGGCAACQLEAITRAVSLGLKYGIPVEEFIDELKEIKCPSPILDGGKRVFSCPDAIAGVLKEDASKHNTTDEVPSP